MRIAVCHVQLPPAPSQSIAQKDRQVAVTGCGLTDATTDVPTATVDVTVRALPNRLVRIEVRERLVNGNLSEPVSLVFIPAAFIKPVAATGPIIVASVTLEETPEPPA